MKEKNERRHNTNSIDYHNNSNANISSCDSKNSIKQWTI